MRWKVPGPNRRGCGRRWSLKLGLFTRACLRGAEKRRLRTENLLARFEDLRRADQLDETAAELLQRAYV